MKPSQAGSTRLEVVLLGSPDALASSSAQEGHGDADHRAA